MIEYDYSSVEFSRDRTIRWELERGWSDGGRHCVFVMMNPSSAGAHMDDATVRKCVAFAKFWGYDGIRIVNIVGFIATDPTDMHAWFKTQNKLDLNEHLTRAVAGCRKPDVSKVVLAYGKLPAFMRDHAYNVVMAIAKYRNTYDIKLNKDGSPAHPLYLKGTLTPNLHFPKRDQDAIS